ncbi:MAG TPA: ROK family transcriptional regulator [Steroidobacteraceae bacterium]|jgi:predicted NBD/HSP70 family sugar kinase
MAGPARPQRPDNPAGGVAGRNLSGTNLERAGDHNQRVTLHAIRVGGPVTRSDLALTTGLTAAAIANITNRLLRQRLILEAGTTRGARGQPATKLVINPDGCYSLGLNVDRDHITLVAVDFTGQVRARSSREVKFALPEQVQSFFRRSAGRLLTKAGIGVDKLVGIGVAFPDDIQRAGLPEQPPEYALWGSVSVRQLLASVLPVPIFVENDAAAAAMGEMQFGLGQQYQSFFYVLITAALGGGLVIDGHYFRGATGRSGELGWLNRRELGGKSRQLQNIVSLSALYDGLAAQGYRVDSPPGLMTLDEPAQRVIDHWIETSVDALEDTLVAINCLINPEEILIGGRLPAALVDRLASRLNERISGHAASMPSVAPIRRAAMSDDAPAVGAAILPFSDRFLPTRFALMKNPVSPDAPWNARTSAPV